MGVRCYENPSNHNSLNFRFVEFTIHQILGSSKLMTPSPTLETVLQTTRSSKVDPDPSKVSPSGLG